MKIEFRDVTLERAGGIRAIDSFSHVFDSERGSAVAVLGANGAGKSTLLESVLGLVPVSSGRILVDGTEVVKRNFPLIRARVGMIFQNPDDQLFNHTVGEDVAFGPRNLRLDEAEVADRVRRALRLTGIEHLADRDVSRLSGGEKRRAALAGVLAMNPEAILLDEPTSMLDPQAVRELAAHLDSLPALKLIATHDLRFAGRLCSECVILRRGRLAAAGGIHDLLGRHELLLECGLE